MNRIPLYLLAFIAAAWPWDVYLYIPILGVNAATAAAALLIAIESLQLVRSRRAHIPYELLWPAVCLLLLALIAARWDAVALLLFLVAAMRAARAPGLVRMCLLLTAMSSLTVMVVSGSMPAACVFPTAFALDSLATFAGPRDLAYAGFVCLAAVLCWGYFASRKDLAVWPRRLAITGLAASIAAAAWAGLDVIFPQRVGAPWPMATGFGALDLAGFLLLWLVARIAAKHLVAAREGDAGPHAWFATFVLIAGMYTLLTAGGIYLGHVFVLALAGGSANRKQDTTVRAPLAPVLLAPVILLVVVNANRVFPENDADPRNYDFHAAALWAQQDLTALNAWTTWFEDHAPEERRSHLWRARMALEQEDPLAAAADFAFAMTPAEAPLLLPGPSEDEVARFLTVFRDHISALPEDKRGFAFEHALVAGNRSGQALASLQVRRDVMDPASADPASLPLAQAVACLLGDPGLAQYLVAWPENELAAMLESWGARIVPAPEALQTTPVVAVAWAGPNGLRAWFIAPGGIIRTALRQGRCFDAVAPVQWSTPELDNGQWRTQLDMAGTPLAIAWPMENPGKATIEIVDANPEQFLAITVWR
ncbi:MAG: hypothetical protein KJ052_00955 [Candidatus Hydrogenedentes bacterium]|nr:hypothetical protein [Candidatus Hydrogenedentota bacterium]